jgi:hypothetical protein
MGRCWSLLRLLPTGLADLGGILSHQGVLYGWDRWLGLVTLDPVTGLAVDVNPAVGGVFNGHAIHWMAMRSDGVVVGAGEVLRFSINLSNGVAQFLGAVTADIRGAVPGVATPYGVGCQGGGGPVRLEVAGSPWSPGMLTASSSGHGAGAGNPA